MTEKNVMFDPHLQAALINMYANCGSMDIAQKLYDKMPGNHFVASTAILQDIRNFRRLALLSKHFEQSDSRLSIWKKSSYGGSHANIRLTLLGKPFEQVTEKDLVCWSAMRSSYAESYHPYEALGLFNKMLVSVNNAVMDMYATCGSLTVARSVFDNMPQWTVISWTKLKELNPME
ncbi:pentatricopeptide repeat-containing protein At4g14820-like [Aristolochia californica]|uniref:pentatricopeptide repeat-containing protein At4g14820-like n=1 Tax=Aristolochia californica TaxID=171875 RepID=UPI0035DCE145